jgi:PAS domain S-box-containing protein
MTKDRTVTFTGNDKKHGAAPVALAPPDLRSLLFALAGASAFFVLAYLSLDLFRFETGLATIWVPNAVCVVLLLRCRLSNEATFYALAYAASLFANTLGGNTLFAALIYSLANMSSILLVTWLTRRSCGPEPDMSDFVCLSRFVWFGGVIGPMTASFIAAFAIGPGLLGSLSNPDNAAIVWYGTLNWFLTDSMGMILIVPALLLLCVQRGQSLNLPDAKPLLEGSALLSLGSACTLLIFSQNAYPLLFLIMPITLAHTFRVGSVGTALHLLLVTIIATAMTWSGNGPIVETGTSPNAQLHLTQAFLAANFLTGLPIAAILQGREQLAKDLAEGQRELDVLTNSISDAVLTLDRFGVCTYASPSVRDVLGDGPDCLVGRSIEDLIQEDASDRVKGVLMRLLSGRVEKERFTYRRQLDHASGSPVYIEAECAITLDPLTRERDGIILCARDVTQRVELELLLTRARHQAEDAVEAKTRFLANMSHEIRTPMNGVLGFAELMLQTDLDPEARRHTEMIVESGRSMMLLLNDILDLSKVEAGQITIDTGPIDLRATLEECVALHRQTAELKGLTLTLECGEPFEHKDSVGRHTRTSGAARYSTVVTDGLRLKQIALNLIGNAVKFTPHGSVHVSYWVTDTHLNIRVRDTGIGISEDKFEAIFQPFTQGEGYTARRFGGTGLGLSISRQLAERLGGFIDVESEPGAGSCFTLTLPTSILPMAPEQVKAAPEPLPEPRETLPAESRILLAEDHDANRMLVGEMLERCGQKVEYAHDGNEVIAMVMDSVLRDRPYDLILMDIQMPECDGYSASRAIRDEGIDPESLPIIALTANAFAEDVAASIEAGMQAHVAKPVVFADLIETLQRWLPVRIVETPMDRDFTPTAPEQSTGHGRTDGAEPSLQSAYLEQSQSLHDRWLARRLEAVETVRTALASDALGGRPLRRAVDQLQRENLVQLTHKLAGSAASFGEPELGEAAKALEQALKANNPPEKCERLAFRLLAIADEPEDTPSFARL